jgi:hypothetical protein
MKLVERYRELSESDRIAMRYLVDAMRSVSRFEKGAFSRGKVVAADFLPILRARHSLMQYSQHLNLSVGKSIRCNEGITIEEQFSHLALRKVCLIQETALIVERTAKSSR